MKAQKINYIIGFIGFAALGASSCKKDTAPDPIAPVIENVEVGRGDNGIGVAGEDFHLEIDVVAGDRIDIILIRIEQRPDETYAREWSHEVTWEQYRGARNTNVHQHFDIPEDAPAGRYDFVIIVHDQNGTRLEERRTLNISAPQVLGMVYIHSNIAVA
ncbi:DUF4625 domain-containing protein [Parapedobacter deserti]|uniref:DUF4625 domain-containing protein n=1 Tax=Parapedobacter deserti TaxID=1912957 RepID=A0ABV7JHR3_9SPHI